MVQRNSRCLGFFTHRWDLNDGDPLATDRAHNPGLNLAKGGEHISTRLLQFLDIGVGSFPNRLRIAFGGGEPVVLKLLMACTANRPGQTTKTRTRAPATRKADAELHKHWWARTVSNRRPLVCKTRALPLSYAPVPEAGYTLRGQALKTFNL